MFEQKYNKIYEIQCFGKTELVAVLVDVTDLFK